MENTIETIQNLDSQLFLSINTFPYPEILSQFFQYVSNFKVLFIILIIVFVSIYQSKQDYAIKLQILILLSSIILFYIAEGIMKNFFKRLRPCVTLANQGSISREQCYENSYSFPSFHTAISTCIATILVDFYPQYKTPLYTIPAIVGFSRIVLGNHYPTDVLIGALIGKVFGSIMLFLYHKYTI